MNKPTIFLSHIHEDNDFAKAIKNWLEESFLKAIEVFVSSSPDSLPPGSDWPHELKKALESASITLILISPLSENRRWIYFEAGAAYVKGLPVIPICISGSSINELTPPLSFLQSIDLSIQNHRANLLQVVAQSIGLMTPNTVDVLCLPNRTSKKQHLQVPEVEKEISLFDTPLSRINAKKLYRSVAEDKKKLHVELLTIINFASLRGNSSSPESVLKSINEAFKNGVLISNDDLEKMIQKAKQEYSKCSPDDCSYEGELGYKKVSKVLDVASQYLPSKEDVIDQLMDQPEEEIMPFLVLQYYSAKWHGWTKGVIFDLLSSGDFGKAPLKIIEEYLFKNEVGDRDYKKTVLGARRLLNDDFDNWYQKLKGKSYLEEQRLYDDRKLKKQELELQERKQRQEFELMMAEREKEKSNKANAADAKSRAAD